MKINPPHLILAGLLATATALPAATLIDGFDAGGLTLVANNTDLDDAGGTAWYNQDGTTGGEAFAGTMTSTTLTVDNSPVYDPNSRFFETPSARIINNTASGSTISFSFDYNVSAGSPSIYFHLKGVDAGASPIWKQQLVGRGGTAYVTDSVDLAANNTDTYNLFNGNLSDGGSAADAYNVGNTNVTGTGTVTGTIDLSGHATYQDLSDYEYLAVAFAFDFDEAATVEISNFSVNATTPFVDYFSSDSSADYVYTSTTGTDSATWNVSDGTLNLPVTGGSGQTANIFHSTAMFEIGETVSVDIYGDADAYLSVSTTTRGANTSGEDGVRLHWKADGTFQAKNYLNGTATVVTFDSSFASGASTSVTLYLTRETDNTFSAAYDSGSGLTQLNGTGGTEKQIFTAGDTGNGDLYIGVETWQAGVRTFDNLWAGSGVAASVTPAIISFTSDPGFVSEPGNVTLSWATANAASTTLNGQTVTGTSTVRLVSETSSFTLVVTGADSSTASETMTVAMGESFSIAAVADPQYAAEPRSGHMPELGVASLSYAVTQYNQRNIDWGVVLGDFVDSDDIDYAELDTSPIVTAVITSVGPQEWANTDAILAAWNQLNVPKYNVLGNHEFYVPNADVDGMKKPYSVYRKYGFDQKPYYSFRHKGYRFIVLEGDWRYLTWDPSLQGYTDSINYHNDYSSDMGTGGQKAWWNAAISLTQRRWLMELLDESLLLNERVVCMAHDPINPLKKSSLYNSVEMLDILDGYPNVVMWLNGHHHGGGYFLQNDRHHMNLQGMLDGTDRWYQLTFSPQIIYVYQAENTTTPTNTLDISRAEPSVSNPSGFSVADAAGDAALAWDIEPAGVTQVVIERRHVSTLTAELPSTAETLSWQTIDTLTLPTTQAYLDTSVSYPVAEYKYRIRFLDGIEGSRYSQALAPGEAVRMSYEDYAASLGAGYELSEADADGDGKSNALEQFYGTPPETADRDASRELTITRIPAGVTQLVFSYDASTLTSWDIALSKDLITWKTISRDVDYSIVPTEVWTPAGSSESLTRITIETMDGSSFDFEPGEPANFFRLVVTPSS